jgi:eukaryotic-like serine/threonine-protein kinase
MMNEMQDLVGKRIGRYEVQAHIGRGGMADVYLAYDVDLQRKVALKILLPALAHDAAFVQRFRREAQTVARLDHPNIVNVYDIGLTPQQRPYIAMQYIEGGSLRDRLAELAERGKLIPTEQALAIMRQMAEALSVAHQAGIVHRDLKPGNILVRTDGTPVLVDLGIAVVAGGARLTQTGNLIGTPHYMSPEQVRDQPLDGRSDLYSLGIILYELLAGVRPFDAEESIAILHKQVYEEPLPLEQLRDDLAPQTAMIVRACLQKDPGRRYQHAADLVGAIDQALAAEGSSARLAKTTVLLPGADVGELISRQQVVHVPPVMPPPGAIPPARPQPQAPAQPARGGPSWALVGAIGLIATLAVVIVLLLLRFASAGSNGGVTFSSGSPLPAAPAQTEPVVAPTDPLPDEGAAPTEPPPPPTDAPPPTEPPPTETPEPPTPTPPSSPTPSRGPEEIEIGRSAGGKSLVIVRFGDGPNKVVLVGGINAGFAPGGVSLAQRAITYFSENLQQVPDSTTLYIMASLSPDATYDPGKINGRFNANGVDLNRNWDCLWSPNPGILGQTVTGGGGTRPFSEPEAAALRDFIRQEAPRAVIFWTARARDGLSSPGSCGNRTTVSDRLAQVYGIAAGYQIADFEAITNTTLNGDATNWLDQEGIPAISVLLPDYTDPDWSNNLAAIRAVMDNFGR